MRPASPRGTDSNRGNAAGFLHADDDAVVNRLSEVVRTAAAAECVYYEESKEPSQNGPVSTLAVLLKLFERILRTDTNHMPGGLTIPKHDQFGHQDKRSATRYGISLRVQWIIVKRLPELDFGVGKTINLSSTGLLFEADREIPAGAILKLSMPWPDEDSGPRQLSVTGQVVRNLGCSTAVRITDHQFRAVGMPLERSSERSLAYDAQGHTLVPEAPPGFQLFSSLEERYRESNGLIVMCMHCRRTRRHLRGQELWEMVEAFIRQPPPGASHGLCSPCLERHYLELN